MKPRWLPKENGSLVSLRASSEDSDQNSRIRRVICQLGAKSAGAFSNIADYMQRNMRYTLKMSSEPIWSAPLWIAWTQISQCDQTVWTGPSFSLYRSIRSNIECADEQQMLIICADWSGSTLRRPLFLSLRKHAYSNILKILPPKNEKFSDKNCNIFHISAQNIDYGYSLEPPRRGGSNAYP